LLVCTIGFVLPEKGRHDNDRAVMAHDLGTTWRTVLWPLWEVPKVCCFFSEFIAQGGGLSGGKTEEVAARYKKRHTFRLKGVAFSLKSGNFSRKTVDFFHLLGG